MLDSPEQSETPRCLGSELFLNTMEAMNQLGAVSCARTKPFLYSLFPVFKPIVYAVTLFLIPRLLSFSKSLLQETLPEAFW